MVTRRQHKFEDELLNAEEEPIEYDGSEEDLDVILEDEVDEAPESKKDEILNCIHAKYTGKNLSGGDIPILVSS